MAETPATVPSAPVPQPAPESHQGYWTLVWHQFRKNRLAFHSLCVVVFLFWLAAWGPVLCNGTPFVWTRFDPARQQLVTTYPLLRWLAAPSASMSVDHLFNYFFFLTITGTLLGAPVWLRSRKRGLAHKVLMRRAAGVILGALALALAPMVSPGISERTATSEEQAANGGQRTVSSFRFFRPHFLDITDYYKEQHTLDRARGESALFPPIAQDPVKSGEGESMHSWGAYLHLGDRNWRVMPVDALQEPNLRNVRNITLSGRLDGLDGTTVLFSSENGERVSPANVLHLERSQPRSASRIPQTRIVCEDAALAEQLRALPAGTPLTLFGTHRTAFNDAGEVTGVELRLAGISREPQTLPRFRHVLGTDSEGRDVLARMIHGARISISVGFVSVALSVLLGILIGGLAGYYRGWTDIVISRFIEVMICFPAFFLILTIIAFVEERSIFHVMVIMGLTGWTGVARLVRGEFLKLAGQDFVHSARALGCSGSRVMFRHILPNALSPVLVTVAFGVAGAVLTESSLAFLGFGAPSPTPTWGEMIRQGHSHISEGAWWLFLFPGLSIFLTVTVYNLAGDGLRDAMDPKMRK